MSAEFKISKLRYTWVGPWTPSTVYGQDSVVSYGGQAFVCLLGNTSSSSFYNDLNSSPNPFWSQITVGRQWGGVWTTGTFYTLNTIVTFAGNVYICTTQHTSGVFLTDIGSNYWGLYIQESAWVGSWTPNTIYQIGQLATYGGITYQCIAGHTSSANSTLGLEANQSAWTVYYNGVSYLGAWQTTYRYKANDLVKVNSDVYICTTYHTSSGTSFNPTNWTMYIPGQDFSIIWSNSTTYQIGDVVIYGGTSYVNKTANNLNNIPSLDGTDWTQFNVGYKIKGTWTSAVLYVTGDVVTRNGMLYEATTNGTNQDPEVSPVIAIYNASGSSGTTLVVSSTSALSVGMVVTGVGFNSGQYISSITNGTTLVLDRAPSSTLTNGQSLTFVGVNATYWKLLIPGGAWLGRWTTTTNYLIGDRVVWTNQTYSCIQSNLNINPATDTTNTYWVVLISHALVNSMNTLGDMETFNAATGPQYSRIPIGTNNYQLRVNGTTKLPNWQQINVIPAIYYVDCYKGLDDTLHGTSWDQPFKTIKYACNYISNGLYFSNASALLSINKAWMITEMYQWMLYQCANNIAPFSTSSLFDPFNTQKDAASIIDAVIYDMQRGGNSQIVAATLKYFFYGSQTQLANQLVAATIPYYAPSLTYLLGLMLNAVSQTAPTTSYQTVNGISGVNYISQITSPSQAESGIVAEINSLMTIVITAVTNQNTYLVPTSNSGTTAIINIKTGTYLESLPILVPENVSIVGDELRSVQVQPATSVQGYATATSGNIVTTASTAGLLDQMPIQFITPYLNNNSTSFEPGITPGKTYYVQGSSITSTTFKILNAATQTFIGTISNGSNVISNVNNITNLSVGMIVSGTGITLGTSIIGLSQAISSIATVTLSANATQSLVLQSFTATGSLISFTGGTGSMLFYAGDCLKDMWYMTNGTTMRNLTNSGLLGQLSAADAYGIATPTGGKFVSLAPGSGPDDTTVWIIRRSPYVQNVTQFGIGAVGYKVDGALHAGGSKSFTSNDFTQVISDGIGLWCANSGAITEAVSVFSYYCYIGHYASGGGRIRSTNGNSSYGTYGVVSSGYDLTEVPQTGNIFNQSTQVQASVSNAFGTSAQLIKLNFYNAGSGYYNPATNMIAQSNALLTSPWTNDGNVSFIKNNTAPTGFTEAWLLTGAVSVAGTGYIQQNININPTGHTYTGVTGTSNGTGSGATFNMTAIPSGYSATITGGGVIYTVGNTITVPGTTFGGIAGTNDATLTVATVTMTQWTSSGSAISGTYYYYFNPVYNTSNYYLTTGTGTFGTTAPVLAQNLTSGNVPLAYLGTYSATSASNIKVGTLLTVTASGTVPAGTSQNYTLSAYVYPGNSQTIDIQAIFSGNTTVYSGVSYNVNTNVVTPYAGQAYGNVSNAGTLPTLYGAQKTLVAGWYRVWFAVNDKTGLNTTLTYKLFPQGANAPVANTYSVVYGTQVEISTTTGVPNFYLETTTGMTTAYANYEVTGAGSGANLTGDENRSGAVFNSRIITDANNVTGGSGYATNTANAQAGGLYSIQLSNADAGTYNYINMRVIVTAGTGAGQYGWIAYYNKGSVTDANGIAARTALVLKESVDTVTITTSTGSAITPSLNVLTTAANTDISRLYVNQVVQFVPTYFNATVTSTSLGTLTAVATVGGTTNTIQLNSTAPLFVNMPIIFSAGVGAGFSVTAGYVYYIINITNNTIQIATGLSGQAVQLSTVAVGAGMTMNVTYPSYTGYLTGSNSTINMVPCIPIQFTGAALGGLTLAQNYYINDIIDGNNFTVSSTLITLSVVSSTGGTTNTVTTSSNLTLVPLNAVVFLGAQTDAGITPNTTYYISNVLTNGTDFQLTTSLVRLTAISTTFSTNIVQLGQPITSSTVIAGQPIIFSGIASNANFGGIQRETVYYILNPNYTSNQIQISTDGINPVNLVNAVGQIYARTAGTAISLGGGGSGMTIQSTGTKITVTNSINTTSIMTATYSLSLLGGVNSYTRYYIVALTPGSNPTLSISTTLAGTPLTLITGVGTMQMGASGWDNFNPGTKVEPALDSQSIYYIEPRLTYTLPPWSQVTSTVLQPLTGATFQEVAAGNNTFMAIPNQGQLGAISTNGSAWQPLTLPTTMTSYTSIAFGNNYWIAIGTNSGGNSVALYSNSTGQSWFQSNLPANYTWSSIRYGNGRFVAIAANSTQTSSTPVTVNSGKWVAIAYGNGILVALTSAGATGYSTNNGSTWAYGTTLSASYTWNDIAYNASSATFVAVGTAASGAPVSAYTTSGATWLNGGTMNLSAGNFTSVAASGFGVFVSPGYGTSSVEVSSNSGITWATYSLPSSATWNDIAYGNGIWVALAGGSVSSTVAAYSLLDGQSWTASTLPVSAIWTGITFDPIIGTFVAIAQGGQTAKTTNGYTWTTTTSAVLTGVTTPNWQNIRYGNGQYLAQNPGGTAAQSSATSVDGVSWLLCPMPSSQQWADSVFNSQYNVWVMTSGISTASTTFAIVSIVGPAAYSTNFGYTWTASSTGLLTTKYWSTLAYGNGVFVAIASDGTTAASTDGNVWVQGQAPTASAVLSGVTIASSGGSFSCTASPVQILPGQTMVITGTNQGTGAVENGIYYIYSTTNGATQFTLSATYPAFNAIATTTSGTPAGLKFALGGVPNYTGVAWGNSRFVAVQSGAGLFPAYTFDNVNWIQGLTYQSATQIDYGNGTFVATQSSGTTEYSSDSGVYWYTRTLPYGNLAVATFGFNSNNVGMIVTLSGTGGAVGAAAIIYEGIRAQGRATVTSGVITQVTQWETGANYATSPTVTFTDFNAQVSCLAQARLSNGTLSNPTFVNRGLGYNTTSTAITISGNGFADTYQTGYTIICNNLQSVPAVGSNIIINGVSQVYKVTSAYAVFGTVAPFIEANIQISPPMSVANSPINNTQFTVRALYSQVRLTNHDFLSIGVGNQLASSYPNVNENNAIPLNEAVEINQGHVFYVSTDENGNFAVGSLFGVQQSTGTVTLSATQFGLVGLSNLSLGGLAVGSSQVIVTGFSTDIAFTANSDAILPTQKAIKSYITSRLSQGGANTFTGTLIAGTVLVGNPNFIQSSIPNGVAGSTLKMSNKVYVNQKGVDGNMAALDFFARNAFHKTTFQH